MQSSKPNLQEMEMCFRVFLLLLMMWVNILSVFPFAPVLANAREEASDNLPESLAVNSENGIDQALPVPEIVKKSENILQVGAIVINLLERSLSIKGEINMREGVVEYLACTPMGKLHESVLLLFGEPFHIHTALLLLGLSPGDRPIEFQGAPEPPCGDPVSLVVSWKNGGKEVVYEPENLVMNIHTKKRMEKTDWVFSGSKIIDGQYMAQVEKSIVAIYHDPFAILDHRAISGADDTLMYANPAILPPVGTPVELKILPVENKEIRARVACEPQNREEP